MVAALLTDSISSGYCNTNGVECRMCGDELGIVLIQSIRLTIPPNKLD